MCAHKIVRPPTSHTGHTAPHAPAEDAAALLAQCREAAMRVVVPPVIREQLAAAMKGAGAALLWSPHADVGV